jgi:two-component system chemotaxis response regulator CheB
MIKVLIVDDSALMRRHLTALLDAAGGFATRAVRNGLEALAELEHGEFDVVTLDINMPEMDGMTCLARIMASHPKPVVMVSSITSEGAEATLQALRLGAVDFVEKPGGTISLSLDRIERELVAKVRAAARAKVRRSLGLRSRLTAERQRLAGRAKPGPARIAGGPPGLILIGVSTGGPGTLEEILPRLPARFPWSVLVAQHMPGSFTGVFSRRLNDLCEMPVVEASRQCPIEPGVVYIAKGDADLVVTRRGTGYSATPVPAGKDHLWHPSVDRLVTSALDVVPAARLVGIQLTGMGDDGAAAMTTLKSRGGLTIAQDEESSIVFGMPQDLIRRGGASVVLPADEIADQLLTWLDMDKSTAGRTRHAR